MATHSTEHSKLGQGEKILIAHDTEALLAKLYYWLHRDDYEIIESSNNDKIFDLVYEDRPRIIIISPILDGESTEKLCDTLRAHPETALIPIVIIASATELVVFKGSLLDSLASKRKYAIEEASTLKLIRKLLDKVPPMPLDKIKLGALIINTREKYVEFSKRKIELRDMEYRLLLYLASQPDVVKSRQAIIGALHKPGFQITERTVDVQVRNLRKALGKGGAHIKSVYGQGYMCTSTKKHSN